MTLRPHPLQYIINELPLLVVCLGGLVYAGIDMMPCTQLALGLTALLGMVLLYRFLYMRRIVYHISEEQIICEHGVFVRNVNYMELYRVVDFYEHHSFMQQLFGLKTVSVMSTDRSTPILKVLGVKANKDIVSVIRELVIEARERRHIYEVANR